MKRLLPLALLASALALSGCLVAAAGAGAGAGLAVGDETAHKKATPSNDSQTLQNPEAPAAVHNP